MAERKIRQCPHCKGKTGFKITVWLGGHEEYKVNFKGKTISQEREGTDTIEKFATCLDCGKNISTNKLDITRV